MHNRIFIRLIVVSFLTLMSGTGSAQDIWSDVRRIVAIGDVHGDYDQLLAVLKMADLIDGRGKWIGKESHLVQTGDIPDRGPDSAKINRFLHKLAGQANKKGGYVHLLIGNHEAMNIYGDLRYVHPGEYKALIARDSVRLRDRYYKVFIDKLKTKLPVDPASVFDDAYRDAWRKKYPLGYVEHRYAWSRLGEFGKWVLDHNTIIKINDLVFLHGGISAELGDMTLTQINEQIRKELSSVIYPEISLMDSPMGPLWYRGTARNGADEELPVLLAQLKRLGANHVVMGHSTTEGTVRPRFGGKAIFIDVGVSRAYGGRMACLLIEDGKFFTLHRGERIPLPRGNDNLLDYYEKVALLDPAPSPLNDLVTYLSGTGDIVDPPINFRQAVADPLP